MGSGSRNLKQVQEPQHSALQHDCDYTWRIDLDPDDTLEPCELGIGPVKKNLELDRRKERSYRRELISVRYFEDLILNRMDWRKCKEPGRGGVQQRRTCAPCCPEEFMVAAPANDHVVVGLAISLQDLPSHLRLPINQTSSGPILLFSSCKLVISRSNLFSFSSSHLRLQFSRQFSEYQV